MPPIGKKPFYKLGINLFDLDQVDPDLRKKLLVDKEGKERVNRANAVHVELDRISPTMAVVFTCDILTAALVIDILRSECRRLGKELIRGYINRGGESWARLLSRQVLTILDENRKPQLNPEIFRPDEPVEPSEPIAPLEPERMF